MEKNILILATTEGFLYKFELENVKLLQDMGYTVHYAANTEDPHYLFDDKIKEETKVWVHHLDVARSPYLFRENHRAFLQLVRLIKTYKIRVLHCHTPMGGVLGRLAGYYFRKEKLRVIYTAHGFHFYQGAPLLNNSVYYAVERLLARFTDVLVVINEEDYRNGKRLHLKPQGRVYKIPGVGLDMERFSPMSEENRQRRRRELGIREEDFFFVSVGELNENKNQMVILEALAERKKEKKELSRIRYGICGNGFFEERIRERILELGLEENVIMFGYCTRVWEILGCADASVFPSKREGLGMAGVESLSMGIPVVASDNRGTREYMEEGKNGFLCRWDHPEDFILGLEKLMDQTMAERTAMKKYCRESAKKFEKTEANKIMKAVYESVDRQLEGEADHEKKRAK